jgi:hypothetical protein
MRRRNGLGPQYDDVRPRLPRSLLQPHKLTNSRPSRGLNSIYLQAEHVKKSDQRAFCQYILNWHLLLHVHHSGEETDFFPHVEELSGEKGIMERNVQQHQAFHDGLDQFAAYVKACAEGSQAYDGKKIVAHIDGFGKPLTEHLADEIPSIQQLKRFGDKLKCLPELMQAEAEKNMVSLHRSQSPLMAINFPNRRHWVSSAGCLFAWSVGTSTLMAASGRTSPTPPGSWCSWSATSPIGCIPTGGSLRRVTARAV